MVRAVQGLVFVGWALILAAWLLIVLTDVETVIATGPAIFLIGSVLIILGILASYPHVLWLGLAHVGICLLLVALVNIFQWGPAQATQPFTWIGLAYLLASLPWIIWIRAHSPPSCYPWECVNCGYLLHGLTEPRCPECGTPFDPARLREPTTVPPRN